MLIFFTASIIKSRVSKFAYTVFLYAFIRNINFFHTKSFLLFIYLVILVILFLLWVKFICLTLVQNFFCWPMNLMFYVIRIHYIFPMKFLKNLAFYSFKIKFVISCFYEPFQEHNKDYWSNGKIGIISSHCILFYTKYNNACIHGLYSLLI